MARRSNNKNTRLSQFGLLDVGVEDNGDMDVSDDDMDLEAELAALNITVNEPVRPRKPQINTGVNLDAMVAESLKDIPSDEDIGSDEEDPSLLRELTELAGDPPPPPPRVPRPAPPPPGASDNVIIALLNERISNYTEAETNAKAKGELSRARRFARGLKNLQDLLKQAQSGKSINEADIPPQVSTGKTERQAEPPSSPPPTYPPPVWPPVRPAPPAPSEPAELEPVEPPPAAAEPAEPAPPGPPASSNDGNDMPPEKMQGLQLILNRQKEFKLAALSYKQTDKPVALELMKVVKQLDIVVEAYKKGQEMDLNELPTVDSIVTALKSQKEDNQLEKSAEPAAPAVSESAGLVTASTADEALKQRLAVYQEQEANAKEQNNASKQRRMGRIVKQYQDAIRLHSAGKPVNFDELPTPPGFAPIPTGSSPSAPRVPSGPVPSPPRPAQTSRADKQIMFLLNRQKEFREAALRAKRSGNLAEAKEHLRAALGFDAVLEAARGGLAVDLKSLPVPPTEKQALENTFDVVSAADCDPSPEPLTDETDVLSRLVQQLSAQLRLCVTSRDHCRAVGNIAETNRFENLAVTVKQDLDVVVVAKGLGQDPPKFHYENKQFSIIQCNTDLNENDLELTIVRGIAYNVPNPREVDTYVKFEFPYPPEAPVSDRTALVKDTNSPEYNAVFPLVINRSSRPCQRVFKRHSIKLQVYSRGGWFSKDTLLGSVTVKLSPLETHVTHHEAYPLMDGRRPAGGSLEVKLRVRTPIQQQEFDNKTHRWLVIDN